MKNKVTKQQLLKETEKYINSVKQEILNKLNNKLPEHWNMLEIQQFCVTMFEKYNQFNKELDGKTESRNFMYLCELYDILEG